MLTALVSFRGRSILTRKELSKLKVSNMGDDGRLQKMEVDYSSTCDEKIPECEKLAKVS